MQRGSIAIIACLMVTLSGLAFRSGPALAQEGTPAAGMEEAVAPGVTFGLLPASEDPPSLYRLRLQPGAVLPFAGDPAISLIYVEAGALALRMNAPVSDARRDAGDATATAETSFSVAQGDYLVLPPLVAGEMRNEGPEVASIVVAAITPGLFPAAPVGTPPAA